MSIILKMANSKDVSVREVALMFIWLYFEAFYADLKEMLMHLPCHHSCNSFGKPLRRLPCNCRSNDSFGITYNSLKSLSPILVTLLCELRNMSDEIVCRSVCLS